MALPVGEKSKEKIGDTQSTVDIEKRLLRRLSKTTAYPESMIKELMNATQKYVNGIELEKSTLTLKESDTLRTIVDAALKNRRDIDRWVLEFITFTIILHHSSDTDSTICTQGHNIILHGLALLVNTTIMQRILEPSFSKDSIYFISLDRTRIEKCLLSLALEKYPKIRNMLDMLKVDLSCLKVSAPSRTFNPVVRDQQRKQIDFKRLLAEQSNTAQNKDSNSVAPSTYESDSHMNRTEWLDMMNTTSRSLLDTLNKEKPQISPKSINPNSNSSGNTKRTKTQIKDVTDTMLSQAINAATLGKYDSSAQSDLEDEAAKRIAVDLAKAAQRGNLSEEQNLLNLYEKSAQVDLKPSQNQSQLEDRGVPKLDNRPAQWGYQMLVKTKPILELVDVLLEKFRDDWAVFLNDRAGQPEVRWCIMIDNSGSMSSHRNFLYESLVILMELLRKMEFKFAVARFGGRVNQQILKDMDSFFTDANGQFILEAITFDEGTYSATGLARIADKVFPVQENPQETTSTVSPTVHKLVLMITDGLTQERNEENYSSTILKYGISLGIMFIETETQASSQLLVNLLKNMHVQNCVLKSEGIKNLPLKLAELMNNTLQACPKAPMSTIENPTVNIIIPTEYIRQDDNAAKAEFQSDESEDRLLYSISNPNEPIPKLHLVKPQLISYLSCSTPYTNYVAAAEELRQYYQKFVVDSSAQNLAKVWKAEESRLSGLIDELTSVLGELVFPLNKFTRRRPALRGSSLYLPGLIKAMTSEWTYKKIFSAKLAGGKRDHVICLVLDVSISMFGSLGHSLRETVIALISAFQKMGIENYGVIVFGRTVRLLKTNEQTLDTRVMTTLMQQIRFDQDDESKDAQALEVAIDLLINSTSRGEKKIFVITDGYGNSSGLLPLVQQRAENNNIDLIAMAIGHDRNNLRASYQRYLCCQTPYSLPKALRDLFENASTNKSIEWSTQHKQRSTSISILDAATTDPNTIFNDLTLNKSFVELIQQMEGERDIQLSYEHNTPSKVTIDICFCLDCTGSMSRWLSETKIQMKAIINGKRDTSRNDEIKGIEEQLKDRYPTLNLEFRFAIVGFRDVHDTNRFEIMPFETNIDYINSFLNKLTADGGGDLPEDVMGALDQCLNLPNWISSNARFIILMTDAPGHGKDLNDDPSDEFPNGTGHTLDSICDRLLDENSQYELMFCCVKPGATLKMRNAFERKYSEKKEKIGKTFTTIHLFKDETSVPESFHFIFVLDESDSMDGQPWQDLVTAYETFLTRRKNDQGANDFFSVIQFASNSRITCQRQLLFNTTRELKLGGGGTRYLPALEDADLIIAKDNTNSSVVMIFMSDGDDGGTSPLSKIDDLVQKYGSNHKFICHTVGFGPGVSSGSKAEQLLKEMATHGNGTIYLALDGLKLTDAFGKIAADCTVTGTLVKQFAEILSRDISVKIAVDYL